MIIILITSLGILLGGVALASLMQFIACKLWYTDFLKYLFIGLAIAFLIAGAATSLGYLKIKLQVETASQTTYITSDGKKYNGTEVTEMADGFYVEDDDENLIKIEVEKIIQNKKGN